MFGRDALHASDFARGPRPCFALGCKKKPLNPYDVHEQRTHETPPAYLDLSLAVRETSKALKGASMTSLIPNLQAAENIRRYTSSDGTVNIVRG